MSDAPADHRAGLPPLSRDLSFWGMTATQFLGAFNDNLFKQVVLLLAVDYARRHNTASYQPLAQALFALPFVLFSGFAGFLADRFSKRRIVVLCKLAEIVVILLGMTALAADLFPAVLAVVFLMGTHSAFFGPAKYGILPEIVRDRDLPAANGIFLMTTFVAIIFGMAGAGYVKAWMPGAFLLAGGTFAAIALLGTATSLAVRPTPVAHPGLPLQPSSLAISRETFEMFLRDRALLGVLLVYSLFWFLGGIVQPSVNDFGKRQLQVGDESTSWMAACLGVGIASGCGAAGWLSGKKTNFRLATWGAWGIVISLGILATLGALPLPIGEGPARSLAVSRLVWTARAALASVGFSAGLFAVPLQVFLQARPPEDQKGRVIGAMNLTNWIAILISAGVYHGFDLAFAALQWPISTMFAATALMLLPVAILYRPNPEGSQPLAGG